MRNIQQIKAFFFRNSFLVSCNKFRQPHIIVLCNIFGTHLTFSSILHECHLKRREQRIKQHSIT